MTKEQFSSVLERLVYGIVTFFVMKWGSKLGLGPDDVAWLAGGAITLGGGAIGWWRSRPAALADRAAAALPDSAKVVLTTDPNATPAEKAAVLALANAAGDKVVAKTTG